MATHRVQHEGAKPCALLQEEEDRITLGESGRRVRHSLMTNYIIFLHNLTVTLQYIGIVKRSKFELSRCYIGSYAIYGSDHISLIEALYISVSNPNLTQIYKTPSPAIKPTFCHPRKDPLSCLLA